jgi:Holliday junction resolvase RusA-like endonuclease
VEGDVSQRYDPAETERWERAKAATQTLPEAAAPPDVASGSPLVITVHGTPAPQGSKRHVGNGVMVESSAKVKPWREAVKWAAIEARADPDWPGTWVAPLVGPLNVVVAFYLPRPRSHYRTGKHSHELRDGAPFWIGKRPDLDKILRSTFDALGEAGCWIDDAQVAIVIASKAYADHRPPGAVISLSRIVS